ncbi:FIST C-terminal domain-containing protein [Sulfurimonas sp.]|nr:FIST C-terminal domain-containing protein [Sulfurimonas sp.]
MHVHNHIYTSKSDLESFIDEYITPNNTSILIQFFSGVLDTNEVQKVLNILKEKLPHANIIGASTSGEIANGSFDEESIVLSFSVFETTTIKTYYTENVDYDNGITTAKEILEDNAKAVIAFSETFQSDAQNFFKGFETINNKIIISGGNAGDNEQFQKTFVIKDNSIYDKGIVLCVLISKELSVKNNYTLNWTPIGSELTITKAHNNIIYEINDTPVLEVYKYYFGDDIEKDLPSSIVDFPLIKDENGIHIARSLIMLLEDKSFLYAGHFSAGDKVRFSIGNVNEVLQNAHDFSEEVSTSPAEAIFIYSCSVRRNFLKKELNNEFRLLEKIAPVSGFLTYGEFFNTGKSNQVLNITTTTLALSETKKDNIMHSDLHQEKRTHSPLKSLTHLVNVTQDELENKLVLLKEAQSSLIESEKMASLGALVAGISHEVNTPLGVGLSGISQIDYEVKKLDKAFNEGTLTEEDFAQYIKTMQKMSKIIHQSLDNAANLVKSFKSISVDQHSDDIRVFNFKQYIDDTVLSLSSILKQKDITLINSSDESIELFCYPGSYSQIFSNLILNSVNHAFEETDEKVIHIHAQINNDILVIDYNDNGKGITKEVEKKIFDPFFTTTRGTGGSGLGMNIIYNLVTQKLNGTIELIRDKKNGFHVQISINISKDEGINNG